MTFLEEASEAIRQSGGRMTNQRQIIIELLDDAGEHLDAEMVYERARARDGAVSLATVYRTLSTLEEAGLLKQHYISPDHDRKYYEPAHAAEEYHFTCRKCHRVIPFRSELIAELVDQLSAELNVSVAHACLCFDGLCPDCRDKES